MPKQHLLDSGDLLRICKHVLWPTDSLKSQVNFITAATILSQEEWGNLQPFELWNRVPWALRKTVFVIIGELLDVTRTIAEALTFAAYSFETAAGVDHPGTKGLQPTPKYSLPFLQNPVDLVDVNVPFEGAVDDKSVLGSIDGALRAVYSILQGRYL